MVQRHLAVLGQSCLRRVQKMFINKEGIELKFYYSLIAFLGEKIENVRWLLLDPGFLQTTPKFHYFGSDKGIMMPFNKGAVGERLERAPLACPSICGRRRRLEYCFAK